MTVVEDERPTSAPGPGVRLAQLLGVRDVGRALRDFVTYLPTQVIPAVAGFLVLPILARRLAPTELGVLTIAQTLISLGWIFASQWLTTALMRELPAAREAGQVGAFSATLLRGLGIAGLLFGVFSALLAAAGLVSSAVADNLGLIVAASAGLILQNVAVSLFAASLRPRGFAVVELLARVGGIALGAVLVFEGYKVHGYLLGLSVASLVVGAAGVVFAWPRGSDGAPGRLRPWLDYGFPVSIAAAVVWALFFVDRYLLALLESTGAVGVYSVSAVIGDKAVAIPTFAFFTAARPLLITAMERHGRQEVERLMRAYTRVVLLIGLPIVAVSAVSAKAVVQLLAGDVYYGPAGVVVPLVALGSLIYALALFGNTGLTAVRRSRPLVYAAAIALAANIGANVLLIPAYGVKGAAAATLIGNGAFLVAAQLWARRHAAWRFPFGTLVRGCAAAALGYGAARAALELEGSPLAQVSLASLALLLVYAAALALLGERRASS